MTIDPQPAPAATAAAPRFRRIVEQLRKDIISGGLPEHAALPSERAVAEACGVSRMTARRALEAIEAEGLAYSEGRRGRFVSPKRISYDISNMVSFAANAQMSAPDMTIELISSGTTVAGDSLARALSVARGAPLFEYARLFRVGGHPAFLEREYALARRFPGLLDHDLRQSTTRLIEQHYQTAAHTGDITIRMCALTPQEAGLLGLTPHQAGIELEQVICDRAGTPFCFGRQIWRGELAEFTAQAIVRDERA